MMTLFIDTCSSYLRLAIVKDNQILVEYDEELKIELSTKCLYLLQEIMNNANIKPNEIDQILVANGPGSFTGIRIGVTIAKTYAWSLNKKIIPISSLEALASTNTDQTYLVPLIDARREAVYAGIYDNDLNPVMEDKYLPIASLKDILKEYPNHILISNDNFEELDITKPKLDILKIINKYKNTDGINPHSVNPNYLKLTEAETKLQDNKND